MSQLMFSTLGFLATVIGAICLYLSSSHQRLLKHQPNSKFMLGLGLLSLVIGIIAWVVPWGGVVGGLLALAVWMLVSVALPYLLAWRNI